MYWLRRYFSQRSKQRAMGNSFRHCKLLSSNKVRNSDFVYITGPSFFYLYTNTPHPQLRQFQIQALHVYMRYIRPEFLAHSGRRLRALGRRRSKCQPAVPTCHTAGSASELDATQLGLRPLEAEDNVGGCHGYIAPLLEDVGNVLVSVWSHK